MPPVDGSGGDDNAKLQWRFLHFSISVLISLWMGVGLGTLLIGALMKTQMAACLLRNVHGNRFGNRFLYVYTNLKVSQIPQQGCVL